MSDSKSALDSILKSVVSRDGGGSADTMLVNAHLAQMKMFGIRQGVEFYPDQDNFGTQRFDFVQQVIRFNKLDARCPASCASSMVISSACFPRIGLPSGVCKLKVKNTESVL